MPDPLHLTKHHGLGNDFLIAVLEPPAAGDAPPIGADTARRWCDRRLGVGADGLIVATPVGPEPGTGSGSVPGGDVRRRWRMELWNADGGRAELSGNGLRCLGHDLVRHLGLDRDVDQELTIDTDAGARPVVVLARRHDEAPETATVRVAMGKAVDGPAPSDRWSELGVPVEAQVGVDLGNPHLVAFVDSVDGLDMAEIGPVVEADHPGGCNVHVAAPAGPDRLALRVWERGAGVTLACGSGACAAAWAAHRTGRVGASVTVDMPGGSALVELGGDEIELTGPATVVAEVRPLGRTS